MREAVLLAWQRLPVEVREPTATEAELLEFETAHGAIPESYRWFLAHCGGGPVGAEHVDSIAELAASHAKFRRESGPGGWTMRNVFIVGWDGSGNPYGIEAGTGRVVVEDHDVGGVHELASSFDAFLSEGLVDSASGS